MKTSRIELIIKEIANTYFIVLREIRKEKISSGEEDYYSPFLKYYRDVEEAFSRLDREKKTIVNNEYFYQSYNGWWTNKYKPRVFNKIKKAAIKEFVEAFYEIH